MENILFNVFRIFGISMFSLSLIAIAIGFYALSTIGKNGELKGEEIKEYETIRIYGIFIPFIAMTISLIILAPVIFIELYTNL